MRLKKLSNKPVNNNYVVVKPPSPPSFTPEWALFRFLEEWTPEDLDIAVRKNVEVDFSSVLGMVEEYVAAEILKKFEIYRPDLHKTLSSSKGIEWLKKSIRKSIQKK